MKYFIKKKFKKSFILNKIYKIQPPLIQKSINKNLGIYQINNVMKIAKILNINAYNLATIIAKNINLIGISKIIISQPGFINISFAKNWLEKNIQKKIFTKRLNIEFKKKKTVVIDYSSPNIAKEMHVGHLRSTILGDATARLMKFLGYNIIRVNHIGDWGIQFGILIAYLSHIPINKNTSLKKINNLYIKAKKKYNENKNFKKKAKQCTIKLQNGDIKYISIWKKIVKITIKKNQKIYKKLQVNLKKKHIMGESSYNYMIPKIIKDLIKKKIAIRKNGKIIVFLKKFKNKNGQNMGVVIQKKNGSFLYTTIDIACIKYRYKKLKAKRIIYYVDSRQKRHLQQVWEISKKAGYIPKNMILEHHNFGMMLKENNKPFKTRSGNIIKLTSLIKKSIINAKKIILKKKPTISKKKLQYLGEKIGIGAIKYSDLSKNREKNYIFNWKNILSFNGNTALYIQYSYTRIISIFKKIKKKEYLKKKYISLKNKTELNISIKLLQFEEILLETQKKGSLHILCNYLYDLSVIFSLFYEKYSILFASIKKKITRLKLILIIKKTLKIGLYILGISTLKQM
ncbi:arginine--tRNA ligase [Buchnera aphidicola (Mollitrichosiphum nigrofasciatum)]